jgi:cytochrome c2
MTGRSLAAVAAALLLPALVACAGSAPRAESTKDPDDAIAAVHARKCGRCHARPEPKTRTREHLADAFGRHRSRVHLTPDQWRAMIDYLGAPEGSNAAQAR